MLSYQECINWLFKQFPNYQKEGKNAYKADLENISDVLSQLNNPHKKLNDTQAMIKQKTKLDVSQPRQNKTIHCQM